MIISFRNISKSYLIESGFSKRVFNELNFELNFTENKFISLIAPNGSGKSTLLKLTAGLIRSDSGKIIVNGNNVDEATGNIVYIPSEPASIPWLNVKENIEFGISKDRLSVERTNFIISLIGLEGYEEHIPDNNSIGFRFRLSLGRALYSNPELILLDEPFNKLDFITKEELFSMFKNVFKRFETKFLLATSNLLDASFLSDEVIIFSKEQSGIIENLRIEKSFQNLSEMLHSEYFNQTLNRVKLKYPFNPVLS